MLDIKLIRENPDKVRQALTNRNMALDIDVVLALDEERRANLTEVEALKAQKNAASKEIGQIMAQKGDATAQKEAMKVVSQKIAEIDKKVAGIDENLRQKLLSIPNIPHESVPVGPDASANVVVKEWGEKAAYDFPVQNHIDIVERLDMVDFKRATKITGANFLLFKGMGARLERALLNFMLDLHTQKHGYFETSPPFLVNRASMIGTGQLPKMEEDMYCLKDEDFFLIPTAEVPVTNIYRDEILNEEDLPLYRTAYTPCFRREAGSYGKDTRGMLRVHQFDKVELVKFVAPEASYDELEKLLLNAEEVLQLLELPYRIVALSTGDISFAASKCYDIEAWAPGSNMWLEVSSCSNFEDFQARRARIQYRPKGEKKAQFIHTLNGSGVALCRTFIALLEVHQQADGSIRIPKALQPYMGIDKIC